MINGVINGAKIVAGFVVVSGLIVIFVQFFGIVYALLKYFFSYFCILGVSLFTINLIMYMITGFFLVFVANWIRSYFNS